MYYLAIILLLVFICYKKLDHSIAHYYETRGDFLNAGTFFAFCKQYQHALQLFIQAGEPAIEVSFFSLLILARILFSFMSNREPSRW